jgi:hypothetical protein
MRQDSRSNSQRVDLAGCWDSIVKFTIGLSWEGGGIGNLQRSKLLQAAKLTFHSNREANGYQSP